MVLDFCQMFSVLILNEGSLLLHRIQRNSTVKMFRSIDAGVVEAKSSSCSITIQMKVLPRLPWCFFLGFEILDSK